MATDGDPEDRLDWLDLSEYERTALAQLFRAGRTTAPDLAETTGIPKARIYGVLDDLADRGFVEVIPGRPKGYQPKPPETVLDRATENRRQEFESFRQEVESVREEFLDTFGPLYETADEETTPTEELFHVVDVGDPSESETRALYHDADEEVRILTKSFEYLPSIEPALQDALERGVSSRALFLHPRHLSADNAAVQEERIATLRETAPDVAIRFSEEPLPWRGTVADPSMDYDSGRAILLVEEKDIPLHKRQAAVTENGSFVAGLMRYFDLIWAHESVADPED
jgi:sugar-specific transcriptional regulator TrmB